MGAGVSPPGRLLSQGTWSLEETLRQFPPTTLYPLICWETKHTAGHGVGVGRRRLRPSAEKTHCLQGAAAPVICAFLSGDRRAVNMRRQLGEWR